MTLLLLSCCYYEQQYFIVLKHYFNYILSPLFDLFVSSVVRHVVERSSWISGFFLALFARGAVSGSFPVHRFMLQMLKTVITWRIWFKVSIPGRNDKRFLMLFFSFRESEDRQEATEAVRRFFKTDSLRTVSSKAAR